MSSSVLSSAADSTACKESSNNDTVFAITAKDSASVMLALGNAAETEGAETPSVKAPKCILSHGPKGRFGPRA